MSYEKVLKFWFGDDLNALNKEDYKQNAKLWFQTKWETDELIKEKFGSLLNDAENGNLANWESNTKSTLALIIIFDQFSRNIYRGTPKMFANDSKALELSIKILENDTEFNKLSLVEKLFIYMPLLHSENPDTVQRAMDGIEKLHSSAYQSQKSQYMKEFQSCKVHLGLLKKYGRYPHRNFLLDRESTRDELEFLERSKHNFVKSVQAVKKPAGPTIFQIQAKSITKTEKEKQKSNYPFQNLLFLHGFRQNSNKIKKRTSKLINYLKNECNIYITFLNGTHPYKADGEIANQLETTLGGNALNSIESQRVWYNSDDNAEIYSGIDQSIDHVIAHVKLHGPYDGIVGFGQGSVLASLVIRKNPSLFRYYISISGFQPRSLAHKDLFKPEDPFDFPSIHVYGKKDILINPERSELFASCFKNSVKAPHNAGHFAPDNWPLENILEFIREQSFSLKPFSFIPDQPLELSIIKINEALLRSDLKDLNLKPLFKNEWSVSALDDKIILEPFNSTPAELYENLKKLFRISNSKDSLEDKLLLIYILLLRFRSKYGNLTNMNEVLTKLSEDYLDTILSSWTNIFLEEENHRDFLIQESIRLIFVNNQFWKELVILCHICYNNKNLECIYEHLINLFSKQLMQDLRQIDSIKNTYYLQELTSIGQIKDQNNNEAESDDEAENKSLLKSKSDDSEEVLISRLAIHMPRIKSSIDRKSRVGRECAHKFNPYKHIDEATNPNDFKRHKIISYNHYRKVLSNICSFIEMKTKSYDYANPRAYFYLAKKDKKTMEYLMSAPLSDSILNPIPEPVDISSYELMKPLYEWLGKNQLFTEADLKFLKGTVTTDGRLDLCKQVIGPSGIQPLLDSMKNHKQIDRLLLGNNVVGDEGGKVISEFIKSGSSPLKIWYIAGNNFTAKGIEPIAEALINDKQVTGLWLKRNPLKAAGMIPIGNLLSNNNTLEVLDLLNCGLLDEGVKILFKSLYNNSTLKHLYLSANGITPDGLEAISEYFKSGKSVLETIFLGCNRIGNEGAKVLSEGLKEDKNLIRLNLASSRIGAEGMGHLSEALKVHPKLRLLDLGYMRATMDLGELGNYMEDAGAFHLSEFISSESCKLVSLNITHNHITQRGIQALTEAIKRNKTLVYIDYVQFGVSLNEITLTELRLALEKNKNLMKLNEPDTDIESIVIPDHVKEIYSVYRTH